VPLLFERKKEKERKRGVLVVINKSDLASLLSILDQRRKSARIRDTSREDHPGLYSCHERGKENPFENPPRNCGIEI